MVIIFNLHISLKAKPLLRVNFLFCYLPKGSVVNIVSLIDCVGLINKQENIKLFSHLM